MLQKLNLLASYHTIRTGFILNEQQTKEEKANLLKNINIVEEKVSSHAKGEHVDSKKQCNQDKSDEPERPIAHQMVPNLYTEGRPRPMWMTQRNQKERK